ncbi:MAG TPA: TadE/TadG family type IV pilus assembly protein [Solirubrobacteraceae bacterium]|nr:TadE/TadG family type IV pilus assembly protein [Solirubrobacteraceae bacterium]
MALIMDRLRSQRGQSIVEFAVVLPVFLLILMGILYFGRYENYANQATQLSEEGARWAAVNTNPGASASQTLQQYIASQATGELASGSSDVTSPLKAYIYNPTGQSSTVRVCVTATVIFSTPAFSANYVITETSSMHIEQAPSVWTADTSIPSQCPKT